MSAEAIAGLVAGLATTLIGVVVGAHVQSARQREEKFRELMIDAAATFLRAVGPTRKALGDAAGATLGSARGASDAGLVLEESWNQIGDLRAQVPLLQVVFPDDEVPNAAGRLIAALESVHDTIEQGISSGETGDLGGAWEAVRSSHRDFASRVNGAVRGRAF